MDRHEDDEILSALADGALSADEQTRARAHVSSCASCRASYEAFAGVRRVLRSAVKRPMPAELAADIQRLADRRGAPSWHLPVFAWRPVALTAAGLAVFSVFFGLWAWERALSAQPQIPIQALMAAHERYRDEGLLASVDPAQADFASTLGSYENETDL